MSACVSPSDYKKKVIAHLCEDDYDKDDDNDDTGGGHGSRDDGSDDYMYTMMKTTK